MRKSWEYLLSILMISLGVIFGGLRDSARAQFSYHAVINYPVIVEDQNGIAMSLYFTILDGSDQIVTDAQIQSVSMVLEDGSSYLSNAGVPSSDAFIVLVLDTSGSMVDAMTQTREAAIQAVQNAPEDAAFAALQFNSQISLVTDFTKDRELLAEKIDAIRAEPGTGTCLYDAAFQAVERARSAPFSRRAVILLTDGKDELTEGRPCSQHTYDDVLSLATLQEAWVPIHTIGLTTGASNAFNEAQLRDMSSVTGGFSEVGERGSLTLIFTKIVNSLSHQWLAQSNLYPAAGEHAVSLVVTLANGTTIQSDPVPFTASKDYEAPASAQVASVSFTAQGDVHIRLQMIRQDLIDEFQIRLYDIENNVLVQDYRRSPSEEFDIEATNLASGSEYRMDITGFDSHDSALFATSYPFRYEPAILPSALTIAAVEVDKRGLEFIIDVQEYNLEGVTGYEVWLIDESTNSTVPGSTQLVPPESTIHIPIESSKNTTYTIRMNALDAESQILAQASYEKVTFKLNLLERLSLLLGSTPLVPLFFFLVFATSSAYLFKKLLLDPRRAKRREVLLEETAMRDTQALDDWSKDAVRLNKIRLREQARRLRSEGAEPADRPEPLVHQTEEVSQEDVLREDVLPEDVLPEETVQGEGQVPEEPEASEGTRASGEPTSLQIPAREGAERKVPSTAKLTIEKSPEGALDDYSYELTQFPFTIGRADASLVLDFPAISRQHAWILRRDDGFFIRDEDSTNGTSVDGDNITGQGDVRLHEGAIIGLGKGFRIRFSQSLE